MKRVEIVLYTSDDDCGSDIDRAVDNVREVMSPELVIVHSTLVDEAALQRAMQEHELPEIT